MIRNGSQELVFRCCHSHEQITTVTTNVYNALHSNEMHSHSWFTVSQSSRPLREVGIINHTQAGLGGEGTCPSNTPGVAGAGSQLLTPNPSPSDHAGTSAQTVERARSLLGGRSTVSIAVLGPLGKIQSLYLVSDSCCQGSSLQQRRTRCQTGAGFRNHRPRDSEQIT